jgi:hypothetical protein
MSDFFLKSAKTASGLFAKRGELKARDMSAHKEKREYYLTCEALTAS